MLRDSVTLRLQRVFVVDTDKDSIGFAQDYTEVAQPLTDLMR
jgi:hypothetical protein